MSLDPVNVNCQPVTFTSANAGLPPSPVLDNGANVNPAPPPGFTVLLGGLDLDGYCRSIGFARSQLNGPVIAPNAALAWGCVSFSGQQQPIDFQAACRHQYPGFNTLLVADRNNGYSGQCWAQGTSTGPGATTTTFVPPPPPPTPLDRCFGGSNAAGSVNLCVANGRVTTLRATVNPSNGACTTDSAFGTSHAPFGDSASIPQPVPISPSGTFGFNFPGSKVFNGNGQVTAAGGAVGVGIGTGPTAAPGGFTVCTSSAHVNVS